MFDFDALLSLSIVAAGIAGWAAFVRVVAGREPVSLAHLFPRSWDLAWPRGVQEEEPTHWRTELAQRPGRRAVTPAPSPDAVVAASDPADCECGIDQEAAA